MMEGQASGSDGGVPRVVIVGAGFGGLYAARALRKAPVRLTVIDRRNHHLFQPLLYQVATAGLSPGEIAAPIRRVLRRQLNAEVLLADVTAIDLDRRHIQLRDGEASYDYLILATGASHSYFGHEHDWGPLAPGLKTVEDALEIRRRIFLAFEYAERQPDPALREALMTFVVIGAGPTGVELAGTLSETAHTTLAQDFRHIDPTRCRVVLLEALPRVLPVYPPDLSEKARIQLEKLGVQVRTGAKVTAIDETGVSLGDERIETRTVLWGAGVAASPLARTLGAPLDKAGRVLVEPDLSVPGHPEAFVIGDLAAVKQDDGFVPGLAPAAIQEGRFAARTIADELEGKRRQPFRYRDRGSLATIGRASAVANLGKLRFSGYPAWLAWLLVHVMWLIGFRNRLLVLFEWAVSYLAFERGARLITFGDPPQLPAPKAEVVAVDEAARQAGEVPERTAQ